MWRPTWPNRKVGIISVATEAKDIISTLRRFHQHKITSPSTVHPRAEPYRTEHSSSQFGSARILFEPYIIEREHWDLDSVRLALENFERGGDSARKCSVRFGTARGCAVRGAHSDYCRWTDSVISFMWPSSFPRPSTS